MIHFFSLKGSKLLAIESRSDECVVSTSVGVYGISHAQECCESVSIVRTELCEASIGEEILEASEEFTDNDPKWFTDSHGESYTWSIYTIRTTSGTSTIYFLGESNGYYGETTEVEKLEVVYDTTN